MIFISIEPHHYVIRVVLQRLELSLQMLIKLLGLGLGSLHDLRMSKLQSLVTDVAQVLLDPRGKDRGILAEILVVRVTKRDGVIRVKTSGLMPTPEYVSTLQAMTEREVPPATVTVKPRTQTDEFREHNVDLVDANLHAKLYRATRASPLWTQRIAQAHKLSA